jgi:hypothetical protein
MRFALPIASVLTFCIVCIGHIDAIVPFGYVLWAFHQDDGTPLTIRALLLTPLAATLLSSFVKHLFARAILTSVSTLALIGLWIIGIIVFVVHPMPGNQIPNAVPAITSIPFLLAVVATIMHSIRKLLSGRRLQLQ